MAYPECKIEILDEWNIQLHCKKYGREAKCQLKPDPLQLKTINRFNQLIGDDNFTHNRDDLMILGEYLYHLLFDTTGDPITTKTVRDEFEAIFNLFEEDRSDSKNKEASRLRVILIFHAEAGKWASYPWEFLYIPWFQGGIFLAGQKTELILTRFVPEAKKKFAAREGPLKILIAVSTPSDQGRIEAKKTIAEIEKLKSSEIDVRQMNNPCTFSNLKTDIEQFEPDILHFIGHGRPNEIAFVKEADDLAREEELEGKGNVESTVWKDSTTFRALFDNHQPRLVFLHACQGAATMISSLNTFKNTARELVYSDIPAVVAMQYSISNQNASMFAETFYRKIGEGMHIDEAVVEARRYLGNYGGNQAWDNRGFGTPVVYQQLESQVPIVTPQKQEELPPSNKVPCPNNKCLAYVLKKQTMCTACKHALMPCPVCQELMDKDNGLCGFCGYDIKASKEQKAMPGPKPVPDTIKSPKTATPWD